MKVGQIYLESSPDDGATHFSAIVEALDKLAIDQHVLVADVALARSLHALPYVTVGPVVRTPIMAYCLMPEVDVVHIHDDRSGQTGLLMTLTRSVPFILSSPQQPDTRNPLKRSVIRRAHRILSPRETDPETLIEAYRRTIDAWSKLPQDADCGQ